MIRPAGRSPKVRLRSCTGLQGEALPILAGGLLAAACAPVDLPAPPRPALDLAEPSAWEAAEGPDPLADHRPPAAACPPAGRIVEGLTLEVDTGLCTYAFLEQPLPGSLRPGDRLEIALWHADLVSDAPGEGHIALLAGGAVLWETTRPIPTSPCAITDVVPVGVAAQAGSPLQLHLHNHGANTWNLFRVRRHPPSEPVGRTTSCDDTG